MSSTYHIKTDTGKMVNIEANNAADAIGIAMRKFKGSRIVECWVGNNTGRIDFEIPKHEPLTKKPKRQKPIQTTMF